MDLFFLIAFEKGTYTRASLTIPIITLRCPSRRASMAATPMRLAMMRSCALGEPPRWMCPRITTRTSNCGYSFSTRSATFIAPPVLSLSETSTMLLFFVLRKPFSIVSASWSFSKANSGMIAASAPEAIAPFRARKPASRPMTSTKKRRSCEEAVSRILSTAETMVFSAVS